MLDTTQLLLLALSPPVGGLAYVGCCSVVPRRFVATLSGLSMAFATAFMLAAAVSLFQELCHDALFVAADHAGALPALDFILPFVAHGDPAGLSFSGAAVMSCGGAALLGCLAVVLVHRTATSRSASVLAAMFLHTASEGLAVGVSPAATTALVSLAAHNAFEGFVVAASAGAAAKAPSAVWRCSVSHSPQWIAVVVLGLVGADAFSPGVIAGVQCFALGSIVGSCLLELVPESCEALGAPAAVAAIAAALGGLRQAGLLEHHH